MSRSWFVLPVVAALLIAGCSAGAVGAGTPSAPTPVSPAPPAAPSLSSAASSPAPAAASAPAGSPPSAASVTAIGAGEPWLLFNRRTADGDGMDARLVRPDGTDEHRILTDVAGDIRALAWSPDGTRIAFVVRDATTDGTIWTANADGTGAAKLYDGLADGCGSVFYPAWSPDGTKMALVCYVDHGGDKLVHSQVAVLDLPSKHLTTRVDLAWPDFLDDPLRWSHDGKTIAFAILHWDPTNQFLDGSQIATVAAGGSTTPRHLTKMTSFATYPDWSGDDGRLVYNTYDTGNMSDAGLASNIFTIAADGSDVRQLTTATPGSGLRIAQPRWDPTGSRIWVVVKEGAGRPHLGWVDPATGKVTNLDAAGFGSGVAPRPQP